MFVHDLIIGWDAITYIRGRYTGSLTQKSGVRINCI